VLKLELEMQFVSGTGGITYSLYPFFLPPAFVGGFFLL
jgi:hypothetical protein